MAVLIPPTPLGKIFAAPLNRYSDSYEPNAKTLLYVRCPGKSFHRTQSQQRDASDYNGISNFLFSIYSYHINEQVLTHLQSVFVRFPGNWDTLQKFSYYIHSGFPVYKISHAIVFFAIAPLLAF